MELLMDHGPVREALRRAHDAVEERALRDTIATYDRMAPSYAARFQGTGLDAHMARFLSMTTVHNGPVMDAGCGPGRDCAALERAGADVVGVDLSAGLLHEARYVTAAALVRADLRQLPFTAGSFSGIWSCASLVHVDAVGLATALDEFARVLQPGGSLFVTVRAGRGEDLRVDGPNLRRHFHLYEEGAIGDALQAANFEILGLATEPGVVGGRWVNAFARRSGAES